MSDVVIINSRIHSEGTIRSVIVPHISVNTPFSGEPTPVADQDRPSRMQIGDVGGKIYVETAFDLTDFNVVLVHRDPFGALQELKAEFADAEAQACGIMFHTVETGDFECEGQHLFVAKALHPSDGRVFYGDPAAIQMFDPFRLQFP